MSTGKLEKRLRLMESNEDTSVGVKNWVSPRPIVGVEFLEDIPQRQAFVGALKLKKSTSTAIKDITTILPGFGHLKRCSASRLLLAFVKDPEKADEDEEPSFASADDLRSFLIDNNFDLSVLNDEFDIVSVPVKPPHTRLQASRASEVWPVNFHPDAAIEAMVSGNFFDPAQLEVIEACTRLCIEAARDSAVGNEHCNGAAVVLDPGDEGSSRILAVAAARINEHPMWHPAMLAVDLVARIRGGGAWKLDPPVDSNHENKTEDRKREFASSVPAVYPESLRKILIPNFDAVVTPKSNVKVEDRERNCPYLCTNYWIFLLREPCPLCAMALLHSRVAMIFYGTPNAKRGILGTKALLHTLPGLNHRYKVWTGTLEDECSAVAALLPQIEH